MNQKFFGFLITGLFSTTTISYWASVQAQTQVKQQQNITPKFISAEQANCKAIANLLSLLI